MTSEQEEEEEVFDSFSDSDQGDCENESDYGEQEDEETDREDDGHSVKEARLAESLPSDRDRKSENVAALVRGNLIVKRQPLIPRILSVSDGAAVARKPFKPPCPNRYKDQNVELARRLWARKRFVPWGSSRVPLVTIDNFLHEPSISSDDPEEKDQPLPPGIEPLILWQPDGVDEADVNVPRIEVDPLLVRYLRPHQREGVQFMFQCVSGLSGSDGISGCILADDMGLGKTLQSITLLYTLLRQGFDGQPMVMKAMIVTPTSLVSNWEAEINKWIGGKVKLLSLCESTRADVVLGIESFLKPCSIFQVLIISYETFRMHSSKFEKSGSCDLLICDEAHRLKNDQTLTNRALAALPCKRRILLSGTPMQNDLEEFFAMVNFTNPGILGDAAYFRRYYETPIISGREPTTTLEERNLGIERSAELSTKVNQFILRRTNTLLSNHLPPKIIEVVCCKLTPLQLELYNHFIQSKNVKRAIAEETKQSKILAYITALKKLCNHPKLIYDSIKNATSGTSDFDDCIRFFPPELFSGSRSGTWTGGTGIWVELSGKMHVLARLLGHLHQKTNDRIVLVSNYTQTLDLFAQLCRERRYPYLRLDGTTSIGKRQKLVNRFNDPSKDEFAFLLSSKAGGCGLNLIGGNRLVLFDPDWNPANDKQAAARVWRDGQKKRVYIYRFLSTGTIEEKVYQRQMSKEGLQKVIQKEQADIQTRHGNFLSTEDLRDLFTFHDNVSSEIHENMNCARCKEVPMVSNSVTNEGEVGADRDSCEQNQHLNGMVNDIGGFAEIAGCLQKLKSSHKQLGTPSEEDLGSWGHHSDPATIPDAILQSSAGEEVTFVFTNQVDGKLVPVESAARFPQNVDDQKGQKENNRKLTLSLQVKQKSKDSIGNANQKSLGSLGTPLSKESKLMRTLPNSHVLKKYKVPCSNQSPLQRMSIASAMSDDDFI
ncbi:DNA repair and recombination protein RAD54 isoform X1 [Canna indica]|uniref:DNA repair and recombination protein RAD54 isoform X1 n=1 Tax=Canna indica TaxID=4628 RepID=A0AAQ3Q081_9LILI|nr:DNA repair and recombination protein RAD54 isoform X1 [Canna indica]